MTGVMGKGTCPLCGCKEARVSMSKSNLGVVVCPPIHEGGCNTQVFARSERSTKLAAERVHTWSNDDLRKQHVGDKPKGKRAKPSQPSPEPPPTAEAPPVVVEPRPEAKPAQEQPKSPQQAPTLGEVLFKSIFKKETD